MCPDLNRNSYWFLAERLLGESALSRLDLKNWEQLRGSGNRGTVPAVIVVSGLGREGTFE